MSKVIAMNILNKLFEDFKFTGDIKKDTYSVLIMNNKKIIAEHIVKVAKTAKILAKKFNVDCKKVEIASYLHDISGIVPNSRKIQISKKLNICILAEEEKCPIVIHQKLSKVIARDIFNINDLEILQEIYLI